jgi:hypothetical protein
MILNNENGDWGLGIGDWAQSPIPNPHFHYLILSFLLFLNILLFYIIFFIFIF